MVWALKTAPVDDPLEHLILIGLADHAGPDGTGARPAASTLAEYARCSVRTVRYRLRGLEAAGLIVRGDQRIVEHLRADRRPVVWDLDLTRTVANDVQEVHPVNDVQEVHDVHGQVARGAQSGTDGVHAAAHKPSMNHPEPSFSSSPPAVTTIAQLPFDAFWSAYPRKVGKQAAAKAFAKAAKKTDPASIINGAHRMAADPNLPQPAFIPHPATWLNQGRWEDAPYPPRADRRPTADDRVRDGLDLAARLAEQEAYNGAIAIGGGW